MAPSSTAMSAGVKSEDLPPPHHPRSVLVNRGEMQTSLSPAEDLGKPKVAILPFSVEALMADRKPSREVPSPDGAAGTSNDALGKEARMGSYPALDPSVPALAVSSAFSVGDIMSMSEDVLIKPESPDAKERTPWIQSSRFSPTPPSKSEKKDHYFKVAEKYSYFLIIESYVDILEAVVSLLMFTRKANFLT